MDDIGSNWQRLTSHQPRVPLVERTERQDMGEVKLPESAGLGASLYAAFKHRRSERAYSGDPIPLAEAATICWAAVGVNARMGKLDLHTAPSAGATFPIELYVLAHKIIDLEPGLYHYLPSRHVLETMALKDLSQLAAIAMLEQSFIARSACTLVWTGDMSRIERRYQRRAYRYVYLEAGHQCQNTLLAAYSLDLHACPIGAFYDNEVISLLGIVNDEEIPLYAAAFGNPV